jgi:putative membrane protein
MMLLPIAALGILVYLIIRDQSSGAMLRREDPMQILRERYARGEISKDDFERMRKDIEKK